MNIVMACYGALLLLSSPTNFAPRASKSKEVPDRSIHSDKQDLLAASRLESVAAAPLGSSYLWLWWLWSTQSLWWLWL